MNGPASREGLFETLVRQHYRLQHGYCTVPADGVVHTRLQVLELHRLHAGGELPGGKRIHDPSGNVHQSQPGAGVADGCGESGMVS